MASKAVLAAVLCCLLIAGCQADMATTLIKACTSNSGAGSTACKGAMSMANRMCSSGGAAKGCMDAAISICQKNKSVCNSVAGPLCSATGAMASQCSLAIKAATSPVGGIAGSLLG